MKSAKFTRIVWVLFINAVFVYFAEIKGDLIRYSTQFYLDLEYLDFEGLLKIDKEKLYLLLAWLAVKCAVPFKLFLFTLLVSLQLLALRTLSGLTGLKGLYVLLPIFPLVVTNEFQIFRQYLALFLIIAAYPRKLYGLWSLLIHKFGFLLFLISSLPRSLVFVSFIVYIGSYTLLREYSLRFSFYEDSFVSSEYLLVLQIILLLAIFSRKLPTFFIIFWIGLTLPITGEIQGRILNSLNIFIVVGLVWFIERWTKKYFGAKVMLYGCISIVFIMKSLQYLI